MNEDGANPAGMATHVAAAAAALEHSSDFAPRLRQILAEIRSRLLPLTTLSYYRIDTASGEVMHYFLHPPPTGSEHVELHASSAEMQAWRQQRPCPWRDVAAARWGLTLPTARGALSAACDHPIGAAAAAGLALVAPALELLVLRHADLQRLEALALQVDTTDRDLLALCGGSLDLSSDDPDEVLRKLIYLATEKLPFDRAGIFLLDREGQVLRGALGMDDSGRIAPICSTTFPLYPGKEAPLSVAARIARGELPFSLTQDLDGSGHQSSEGDIGANIAVPMRVGGRIIGMMAADNYYSGRPIHPHQVRPLMVLANQGAVALERARLLGDLKSANERLEEQVVERTAALSRANSRLKSSLQEREVLLREIHHRVKNNLQVVSSLLSLQLEQAREEPVRQALREGQRRLYSMALIHEALYESPSIEHVDLAGYLGRLSAHIFASYEVSPDRVQFTSRIESLMLAADLVIHLGLIANELIANALKHAFPEARRGAVEMVVQRQDGHLLLAVRDDGVGLPAGFDMSQSRSMGMKVVHTLVRQLRGQLHIESTNGTTFTLRFPLPETPASG